MAKQRIGVVTEADLNFVGTKIGSSKNEFELNAITDAMTDLALRYIDLISKEVDAKDIASSGKLQNLLSPTAVEVNGTTLSIGILAPNYASYVDEGVDGWARSRGSRFKFKTKGVNSKGDHVKSMKEYLAREGKSARSVKVGISSREIKGKSMLDASTKAAVQAAYMIKRFGIKPTHFWRDATDKFKVEVAKELGLAFKIDIINNITS